MRLKDIRNIDKVPILFNLPYKYTVDKSNKVMSEWVNVRINKKSVNKIDEARNLLEEKLNHLIHSCVTFF